MPTNRTPLRHSQQKLAVTPEALNAFKTWLDQDGECTCPPPRPGSRTREPRCASCNIRDAQRAIIFDAFDCFPWELGIELLVPGYPVGGKWDARGRDRFDVLMAALENEHATADA